MTGIASFDYSGHVVLITGGSAGIGAGIAQAFAAANAKVVITGRRLEPLERMAATFPDHISHVQMDVGSSDDRRRTVETVIARHGRLDILINNALSITSGPFEERSEAEIATMYGNMLQAPTELIRLCLPHLKASKGSVINVSSVAGRSVIAPSRGLAVYAASKAGINHLTRYLALELGQAGIRFNSVGPGMTDSEATARLDDAGRASIIADTPLGRFGVPSDIASVALFLGSDAACWVTGQTIDASGGWNLAQ